MRMLYKSLLILAVLCYLAAQTILIDRVNFIVGHVSACRGAR